MKNSNKLLLVLCALSRELAATRSVIGQLNSSTAGICHLQLPKGLSFEQAITTSIISNNVGNVVWIRSAIDLFNPNTTTKTCLDWKDVAANSYGRESINAVVHPTANMIFDRMDRNPYNIERHKGLRNSAIIIRDMFKKMKVPVLSIGVSHFVIVYLTFLRNNVQTACPTAFPDVKHHYICQ